SITSQAGASRPRGWARASSIRGSIILTARSWKTGSPCTSARKIARCSHPAWRRFRPRFLRSCARATWFCFLSRSMAERNGVLGKTLGGLCSGAGGFADGLDESAVRLAADEAMRSGRVAMIFIETPANPTNGLVDIAMIRRIADSIGEAQDYTPIVACDNTLL